MTERIIILSFSVILIVGSVYLGLKSNKILEEELTAIRVTLDADPEFEQYRLKATTHYSIILRAQEYKRQFKIIGKTYEATNRHALQSELKAGDQVELKMMTDEVNEIEDDTFINNYNEIYGLSKGTKSYISLADREVLADKDSTWFFGFTALGLVFLPYGLMKRRPMISIDRAVGSLVVVGIVIILFVAYG